MGECIESYLLQNINLKKTRQQQKALHRWKICPKFSKFYTLQTHQYCKVKALFQPEREFQAFILPEKCATV